MKWYGVLKAARKVGSREVKEGSKVVLEVVPFTAAQLAASAAIKSTQKSRASDIAAGWISKFVRWGYLKRVGKEESGGGRPVVRYELTRWGLRFRKGGG